MASGFPEWSTDLSKSYQSLSLGSSIWSVESDPRVLLRRQKQIDYGKSTAGYHNYLSAVPKPKRNIQQPETPDKFQVCSRRSFDAQIKIWRLLLHSWDDDEEDDASARREKRRKYNNSEGTASSENSMSVEDDTTTES
ncbi:unnamed protein product [Orchesella dallaii]|uniref:Histone RNA hairpin-binding protein RNA-binding domain-containing protein n=1 Tax=Orchesella dallaii TaxID=48710 RepID=A0ABP1PY67_9HEXA